MSASKTSKTKAAAKPTAEPATENAAVAHSKSPSPAKKAAKKAKKKTASPVAKTAKTPPAKKIKTAPATEAAAKVSKKAASAAKSSKKPEKIAPKAEPTATVLESQVVFDGRVFRVVRDHIIEPDGRESHREVIRHNGSVVILAVDAGKRKHKHGKRKQAKDPWVVIERQYRYAAGQYLWELPAGKLDAGENALEGAKRELSEETGYQAREWSTLVHYFASPGFLGEAMTVFLAEGLIAGDAHPEEDENIDFRLVKLSELLKMADKGEITDGKTLLSVLLYARQLGIKP